MMQEFDCEVFLSSRAPDTSAGFTDHLYTHLLDAGVRAFKDADLLSEQDFAPELLRAIEQSKISIPIFSKNYASSIWRLKELAQMVECRKRKGQIIIPIFYYVEPSEVRDQTGDYGEASRRHQNKKRYDDETIREWRAALHEVASSQGFHLTADSNDAEAIKSVVAHVYALLTRKYIVGIEHHVTGVMELLNVESSDVRVVGTHGIWGTAKTTIAKSICKRIFRLFDGCSFLESVRENAEKPGGLVNLQGQLISDLLGAMHRQIPSDDDGIKSIRSRFFRKKLLIVLDDIEPSFAATSNIRFLQLDQANLEGNFEQLLSSLRWLHWQDCPRNLRAENLDLKNLIILDLSWSKVNEKWKGWREIKKAEKLKVLNLTGCVDLIRTPDLSYYKCLERLILERCIRLVEICSSVKSLESLVSLNLRFCNDLNKLPEELGSLISLQEILIDGTAVQEIPASIGHLKNLRRFSACNCLSLSQLPDSISHVKSLRVLALNGTKLTKLPMLIGKLEGLQHLSVSHCRAILKLPTSWGTLASLIELDLSSTGIVELPNTVNELYYLRVLKIDFTFVRELACTIWKLKRLEELHASRCRSLDGEIPRDIEKLSKLRVLRLGYSRIRGLPDSISTLPNLQTQSASL